MVSVRMRQLAPALTFNPVSRIFPIDQLWKIIYGKRQNSAQNRAAPGTLEILILKALERNAAPMYGYGIALYLKQTSQDALQVVEGSLYAALQRMAIKGRVKAEWGQFENNRCARHYNLTPAGRK